MTQSAFTTFAVTLCLPAFAISAGPSRAPLFTAAEDVPSKLETGGPIPRWNGGALISLLDASESSAPVVRQIGPDGIELQAFVLPVPDAGLARIYSAARGPQGQLAIVGMLHSKDGRSGGFLALATPDRTSVKLIRLFPYVACLAAFAGDGTVWTQGHEAGNPANGDGVIRHFDASGKLLASFLPQSSLSPLDTALNLNALAVSGDRIGWYCRHSNQYFEITSAGVRRFPGVPMGPDGAPTGLAITSSGTPIASVADGQGPGHLYYLDRSRAAWTEASRPQGINPADLVMMYGGGGERLALRLLNRQAITFVKVQE